MEVLLKKVTWSEFREMDFPDAGEAYYELLNGEIVERSSPSIEHQDILMRLAFEMELFNRTNNLGIILPAPLDVVLDDENVPQPDLIFIKKERNFLYENRKSALTGTPDLVVEIIWPSSVRRDRFVKRDIYERFGVPEYWLVDPQNRSIEIYRLVENQFKIHEVASENEEIHSISLENFTLDLARIFG